MNSGIVKLCWKLPWGSIGMIGLVLAIEWSTARYLPDYTRAENWDWHERGGEAGGRCAQSDVLIFGDSLVKWGIAPPLLEARLGRSVYCFAITRGQTVASYFMLRRTLAAGAKPKAIIIDSLPPLLACAPEFHERRWAEFLTTAESAELAIALRRPHVFNLLVLHRLLPTLRNRLDIRAALFQLMRGEPNMNRVMLYFYARNWRANRGGTVMPVAPYPFSEFLLHLWHKANYGGDWVCHPANAVYLRKFLELAAERSIPVFWMMTPLHPAFQELIDRERSDAPFERYLTALLAEYPNLSVLDARHCNYEKPAFYDGIHLNRLGNGRLSADVGEVLAERLAGNSDSVRERWVRLPACRPAPPGGLAEDVEQSRIVVIGHWEKQDAAATAGTVRR